MSPYELVQEAYAIDPIACWVGGVALCVVLLGVPFRRGGVDTRFIIHVFAFFATFGTIPRFVLWVARNLAGEPIEILGGTDLVLAFGGFLAVGFATLQGTYATFTGDAREQSLVHRWRAMLAEWLPQPWWPILVERIAPGLSKPLRKAMEAQKLPQAALAEETPQARAERQKREQLTLVSDLTPTERVKDADR